MPYIPDDVLFNCLARVSRLYYPTLSLVSKRFRSLFASTEIYETRSLLGSTESCLYVCLSYRSKPRWFTLSKKPTQVVNPNPYSTWSTPSFNPFRILTNRTRTSSSGNLLVSVPDHHLDDLCRWIYIRVGSDIYVMTGGSTNPEPSSRVCVMDRRSQSHTWHEAPSMLVAKKDPLVSVLDGKIYVVERSRDCDFSNFIEFFDPKTQIWEHVPSPSSEIRGTHITSSVSFQGKLYLSFKDFKSIVYKPEENRWDVVGTELESRLFMISFSCRIDNVLYFCLPGRWSRKLKWYDFERRSWRHVKGLKKLAIQGCVRLEKYGGKLVVLWEENVRSIGSTKEKKIWCAEIALERDNGKENFGKLMWCDVVLVVPASCQIEELRVATI